MMKMRQQQESTCIKRKALLIHNNNRFSHINGDDNVIKGSLITMSNYGLDDNHERDESPVSVISHSATVVSQPSSGCTSMDHHLHHLIIHPHTINCPDLFNPNHPSLINKQKLSKSTSAASTSEDDSSAYNLPTLFFEVAPLQDQELTKEKIVKSSKRKSLNSEESHVADSFKCEDDDDDEHMISIDLTGSQENPMVLRDNFLKAYGKNLSKEEERQAVDKISAKLKQYGEWKEQKLTRSTSGGQEELLVRSKINAYALKAENYAENTRITATNHTNVARNYDGKSLIRPQLTPRSGYFSLEKGSLNLASRKRGINSGKVGVSSKWDDAEKWLCFDNHNVSHHKAEDFAISTQNFSRNHVDHVKVSTHKSSNSASPKGENLSSAKVNEFEASMQDINTCASQSSSLNEKRTGNDPRACQTCNVDYLSSGEIVHPHVLNHKLSAISVSECEIHTNYASHKPYLSSQTSVSSGSISGAEKTKDSCKQTSRKCIKDSRNTVSKVQLRTRECDYLHSGENIASKQNLAADCASDGEIHANYALDQQYKSSASYAQRFKQHLVLQKLRRKCSPNNDVNKRALHNVGENSFSPGKNAVGRTNVHAVSILSNNISMQAAPQKDPMFRQGEYDVKTQSEKVDLERKEAREDIISQARMQTEFVVQTPTHGRSASMKDACTEVSPSLSRRDMGTQMTPSESSPITSKCTSPLQNTSPARHNTPAHTSPTSNRQVAAREDNDHSICSSAQEIPRYKNVNAELELESCHWAKLELRALPSGGQESSEKNSDVGSVCNKWSPAYNGLEEEINVNEGDDPNAHSGGQMKRLSVLDSRAAAWEEAEIVKFTANRYKREEARISAWEALQRAKAQAELKKLEVKLERLRSKATERVLNKMAAAEKRAEEMRAVAEAQQNEHMRKVRERAGKLRKNALFPGSFAVCFARNFAP